MYQVSSHSLHKRCFYSILNVKNGYFSGHLDVIQCNSIYSCYSDFYPTNDVLKSFFSFWTTKRSINMCYDAKWLKSAIWPRDLRWPWPQKRSPRAWTEQNRTDVFERSSHNIVGFSLFHVIIKLATCNRGRTHSHSYTHTFKTCTSEVPSYCT